MTCTPLTAALAAAALAAPAMACDRPARAPGVEPGVCGVSRLAGPRGATEDDPRRADLGAGGAGEVLSTRGSADGLGISAPEGFGSGKAQRAAGPGLDPHDHKAAQPARTYIDAHD